MSKTRKDLPVEIRDPEGGWRYGTEQIRYISVGHHFYTGEYYERTSYWYRDIPGFKTKKKRHGRHWKYWSQITPMWWIHDYMTVPQRAKGKEWERQVVGMAIDDLIDVDLPGVGRKPFNYYW